jgi:hypothetical protein
MIRNSRVKTWIFWDWLRPLLPYVANGWVEPERLFMLFHFWLYQTTSKTLKMGMELFPETSENFHTLTRLSARERYIEFENLKKTMIATIPLCKREVDLLLPTCKRIS